MSTPARFPRAEARSLGLVFLVVPTATGLWLLLPHPSGTDTTAIALLAVLGALCGAALRAGYLDHAHPAVFKAIVAAGTIALSGGVLAAGGIGSGLEFLYLWATPYAYSFFSPRQATLQTALVAVGMGAGFMAPELGEGSFGAAAEKAVAPWLAGVGTVVAVGVLVGRLTRAVRHSAARFTRVFKDSALGAAVIDAHGRYVAVNPALCALLGRDAADLLGRSVLDLTHPDHRDATARAFERALTSSLSSQVLEKRCLTGDGSFVWSEVTISPIAAHGGDAAVLAQAQDVTPRKAADAQLARRARSQAEVARLGERGLRAFDVAALFEDAARSVAETLDVEVCAVYLEGDRASGALRLAAGYGVPSDLHNSQIDGGSPCQAARTYREARSLLIADADSAGEHTPCPVDAEIGARSAATVPIAGADRPAAGVLAAFAGLPDALDREDLAFVQAVANVLSAAIERRDAEEEARRRALEDPLTGLANRTLALDRVRHALARAPREGATVAVLVVDLDNFKVVNDSLGHPAGDEMLVALAPRLLDAIRPSDTVARLGGDEFLVVCENVTGARAATEVADRLQAAIARPVAIGDSEHFLTASIGIAVALGRGLTAEELVRDADAAMHRAKTRGRGRYELFDEQMRSRLLARLRIEAELRRALDRDELSVAYQPVISCRNDEIVGFEALARWTHREWGAVSPADFIPVAEDAGLISRLGMFVLQTAANQVAVWRDRTGKPLELGVNASGMQLADPLFPSQVADVAADARLPPGCVHIEITESVLLEEAETPVTVLGALREHGMQLALDDFGTGYSSLSYLKRFPLDALKIDRSFVSGVEEDADSAAIVEAVVRMAQTLGLLVVAEGVETTRQLEVLRALGCDRAQGFLLGRPLGPAEAGEMIGVRPMRFAR